MSLKNVSSWRLKAAGEETQGSGGGSLFHARGPAGSALKAVRDSALYESMYFTLVYFTVLLLLLF